MRMQLSTWNSHSIQDTSYKAMEMIGSANGMAPSTPNYIDMGGGDPILGGVTLAGASYTFHVQLLGTTDATVESQRDILNSWFRVNDTTPHQLVGLDIDNSNKDWYLEGIVISPPILVPGAVKNLYSITLALTSPYWIEVDANTNTWSITADTETEIMANAGNAVALPKFVITPKLPKGSNLVRFKQFYAVYMNSTPISATIKAKPGLYGLPFDLTNASLDTATIIGNGDMLSNGDDLGVSINGQYVDRWFGGGGINSATTSVWIFMSLSPAPVMTLKVALPNNGTVPAALYVTCTDLTNVHNLYQNSNLLIGSEIITYSTYTVDSATKTITFVPTARNAKNSSYAAHSIGAEVHWIQHDIWLTYGNSTATAPVIDDTKKPAIQLDVSTNDYWIFENFLHAIYVGSENAPYGISRMATGSLNPNYFYDAFYTGEHGTIDELDPVLGIYQTALLQGGVVRADTNARCWWVFSHPCGIENFEATGEVYKNGAQYYVMYGLKLLGTKALTNYWQYATIIADDTWTEISLDVALVDIPDSVKFGHDFNTGNTYPVPYIRAELSSVNLSIFNPPTSLGLTVDETMYKLSGSLENATTGESIIFNDLITRIDDAITIDCETQEIYGADGIRLRSMIQFGGPKRDDWLTFAKGNNSIVFTDVGTNRVDIVTTWRAKGFI